MTEQDAAAIRRKTARLLAARVKGLRRLKLKYIRRII